MDIFLKQLRSLLYDRINFIVCRIPKASQPVRKSLKILICNTSMCFRKLIHLNQLFSNLGLQRHSLKDFQNIIIFILMTPLKIKIFWVIFAITLSLASMFTRVACDLFQHQCLTSSLLTTLLGVFLSLKGKSTHFKCKKTLCKLFWKIYLFPFSS